MSRDPIHEAIQLRAYELFEQRGREHGRDWQDWYEAGLIDAAARDCEF
jgi:hypothetical protein